MTKKIDPFTVLRDRRIRTVLERLHNEAESQTPLLLWHYLPKLPKLIAGRAIHFDQASFTGFYADKYLTLEPGQAAYCFLTLRSMKAKLAVEFGTSFGISTIWLAAAIRANGGGKVITTEIVPEKADRARQNVKEAGLIEFVEIRTGDALQTLQSLPANVDFLLNDGFPQLALDVVRLVAPRLRPGGVVMTDNVGTFQGNFREYVKYMRDPANGFDSMLLPFKSGTEFSVRRS